MASVSLAGESVEPQSLSCAMDVTPGNLSGGPLGSAALIEQIKQAGAAAKDVSPVVTYWYGAQGFGVWVIRWTRASFRFASFRFVSCRVVFLPFCTEYKSASSTTPCGCRPSLAGFSP